jgi:hypothetical protein
MFEGKLLIFKIFAFSPLTYNLQAHKLKDESKNIERIIFGFLWVSSKSDSNHGIDRI